MNSELSRLNLRMSQLKMEGDNYQEIEGVQEWYNQPELQVVEPEDLMYDSDDQEYWQSSGFWGIEEDSDEADFNDLQGECSL